MITQHKQLSFFPAYQGHLLPREENLLFFDIETTGFSSKTASVYLIGAVTRCQGSWHLTQWLTQSPAEEPSLLKTFLEFADPYPNLIHFNGASFDLPFLKERTALHSLPNALEAKNSLDLYRLIRPYRRTLCLERVNQTSLEKFLDIERADCMDGGRLIPVYQKFIENQDTDLANLLLLHNHDDLMGMIKLLPLLAYPDLFAGKFSATGCELDQEDADSFSLIFHLALESPVPKPLSLAAGFGYLKAWDSSAKLLVRGQKGQLKHFFSNYRDYYYLPMEDTAIHKSVGSYVDRNHRTPAKASTCYIKKSGVFLPCQDPDLEFPLFCSSYESAETFMECTSAFLSDVSLQAKYCRHLCSFF